jgi:hypothetical protein
MKTTTDNPDTTKTTFSFHPEDYKEETLDTILDRDADLRLTIKRYTLMEKGFEVPFEFEGNKTNIIHYRDFAADIKVTQGNKTIYAETIQKENFKDRIGDKEFLNLAFLSLVELENYNKDTGQVKIKCMTVMIESDYAYFFQLTIDRLGNKTIEIVETT